MRHNSLALLMLVVFGLTLLSPNFSVCCEDEVMHSSQEPLEYSAARMQFLQEVFDDLDQGVNEGRGYKDYLNTDGFPTGALLAWSESYLMQAYAEMFRATGDGRYLDKLYNHINSVMCNRDDIRGQVDYKDELVPAWGTDRYTRGVDWMHFAAHTGMITYPMLEFVQLAREHSADELCEEASEVLSRARESIDYHDRDWVVQESGFGLYTYPEDYYHKANYIIPLSQQATIGRSLVLLWDLTGDQSYYEKARDIALGIKASLQETEWVGYVWGVQMGPISDRNPIADVSHSTVTVDFIRLAYEHGIVFDDGDLRNVACTIKHLLSDGRAERYINGTGDYAYEITAGQYALLSPYEPEIWELCYRLLFELYRIDLTGRYFQEDWWGTVMLGIARLTHHVVNVPEQS